MRDYDNLLDTSAEHIRLVLSHSPIMTPIRWHPNREVSAGGGTVFLRDGDQHCAECGEEIAGFGGAPYALVLARMRRDLGETYCSACHISGGSAPSASEAGA